MVLVQYNVVTMHSTRVDPLFPHSHGEDLPCFLSPCFPSDLPDSVQKNHFVERAKNKIHPGGVKIMVIKVTLGYGVIMGGGEGVKIKGGVNLSTVWGNNIV